MKKYTKGFTLIELLVVIAIIGILASIVLVSLSTARNKGNDARIIAQISQYRAGAELWSSNHNGTYAGMETAAPGDSSGLATLNSAAGWPGGQGPTVKGTINGWIAFHTLSSDSTLRACADNTGTATTTTKALATGSLCDAVTTF